MAQTLNTANGKSLMTTSQAVGRKAVAYARVSSKEQEKEGFSIPAQIKLLTEYARTEGLEIVCKFIDVETAKAAGRTQFDAMVKFISTRPDIANLLVEKTDRLYRNFKDYVRLEDLNRVVHLVKNMRCSARLPGPIPNSSMGSKCSWPRTTSIISRRRSRRAIGKRRNKADIRPRPRSATATTRRPATSRYIQQRHRLSSACLP